MRSIVISAGIVIATVIVGASMVDSNGHGLLSRSRSSETRRTCRGHCKRESDTMSGRESTDHDQSKSKSARSGYSNCPLHRSVGMDSACDGYRSTSSHSNSHCHRYTNKNSHGDKCSHSLRFRNYTRTTPATNNATLLTTELQPQSKV